MNQREHNARHEAKRKEAGYVRGPRISSDAAERLRVLSFEHKQAPSHVVSRLLIEAGERDNRVKTAMREKGLSLDEARYVVEHGIDKQANV